MMDNGHHLPLEHYVSVNISNDKLHAFLRFVNPDEGLTVSLVELEKILEKNGIKHGVRYDVLAEIAKDPKAFYYSEIAVAAGTPPKDGADGMIRFQFNLDQDSQKPLEREDGTIDYHEVGALNNIHKGQLIAERIPAQEGVHGKAVTGETLFSKKGKEARFKIGKNVVADEQNQYLYAVIDGLLTKTEKDKINVFPIYEVNGDVDFKTGNIEFVGTVIIRGNVLTGFKIKASGDIRVIGSVEGAELEADGSIEITAGIIANNKGSVKAGKNVKTSFIQEGNVEAAEDIIVSQSIMHSHIRAGRNVICLGSKGLIVGGVIQAGEKVTARTIGNNMSTPTSIEVGVLPELRSELVQLKKETQALYENLDKTSKTLILLDQLASAGQISPDKLALRSKLSNTKRQQTDEMNELKERILEIEKNLEDTSKAEVKIVSTIYGGSKIVIGRYTRFIKDATQRAVIKMADGEIVMRSE
ncbi:FapA family protein [Ferviditalea candida]|uniref:FapA family protein n=1 Tax=Ferviditalea candida TaxID=3108399 RepID=A0ABU5ZFX7_9BACL|nr:FapA family protein [Paenibacillaceae bacterium T2]